MEMHELHTFMFVLQNLNELVYLYVIRELGLLFDALIEFMAA